MRRSNLFNLLTLASLLLLSRGAQAQFTGFVKPLDCAAYTGTSADYNTSYTTLWRDSEDGNMSYWEGMGSHPGVDIARLSNGQSANGQAVHAIYDGLVVQVNRDSRNGKGWGNCLLIQHTNIPDAGTIYSAYGHMDRFEGNFVPGQTRVSKGQIIGYVGSTGKSTGPHLHFQLDRDLGGNHPYFPNPVNQPDRNGRVLHKTINPMKFVQDHLSSPAVSVNEGDLVKEIDHDEVYIIVGGAKLHIPSMDEFNAMGYSWSSVRIVPDGTLGNVPNEPRDGTMIRYRSYDPVWIVLRSGGTAYRWHIMTVDAVNRYGGWGNVHWIPNSSADNVPFSGVDIY